MKMHFSFMHLGWIKVLFNLLKMVFILQTECDADCGLCVRFCSWSLHGDEVRGVRKSLVWLEKC